MGSLKIYVDHYIKKYGLKDPYDPTRDKHEKIPGQWLSVWGSQPMQQPDEEFWTYASPEIYIKFHKRVTTIRGDTDSFTSRYISVNGKVEEDTDG